MDELIIVKCKFNVIWIEINDQSFINDIHVGNSINTLAVCHHLFLFDHHNHQTRNISKFLNYEIMNRKCVPEDIWRTRAQHRNRPIDWFFYCRLCLMNTSEQSITIFITSQCGMGHVLGHEMLIAMENSITWRRQWCDRRRVSLSILVVIHIMYSSTSTSACFARNKCILNLTFWLTDMFT